MGFVYKTSMARHVRGFFWILKTLKTCLVVRVSSLRYLYTAILGVLRHETFGDRHCPGVASLLNPEGAVRVSA